MPHDFVGASIENWSSVEHSHPPGHDPRRWHGTSGRNPVPSRSLTDWRRPATGRRNQVLFGEWPVERLHLASVVAVAHHCR